MILLILYAQNMVLIYLFTYNALLDSLSSFPLLSCIFLYFFRIIVSVGHPPEVVTQFPYGLHRTFHNTVVNP